MTSSFASRCDSELIFFLRDAVLVKMRACGSLGRFTQQGFDFYWDKAVHAPNWWEEQELVWRFPLWTLGFDVCAISSMWGATVTVSEDSDNRVSLSFWLLALCISSTSHFMSVSLCFFHPTVTWEWRFGIRRWGRKGEDPPFGTIVIDGAFLG